jgi:hypothetical protein
MVRMGGEYPSILAGQNAVGPVAVGPAPIDSNHHDPASVAAPDLNVSWSDGRQDPETRAEHARRTRRPHHENPRITARRLTGSKGRTRRRWSDTAILTAIRAFNARAGRWPGQLDFRSANRLPGYGTVQRRYGSTVTAVKLASMRSSGPSLDHEALEFLSDSSRTPLGDS